MGLEQIQGEINYKDGTKYTCTLCSAGLYLDSAKSSCIPTCGDSLWAGSEACDDGYTIFYDGDYYIK